MKRPEKLYRFIVVSPGTGGKKNVDKHLITNQCVPQVVNVDYPFGRLWRCQHTMDDANPRYGDFYGYASMKEAKAEEISNTKSEISRQKVWLEKLLKV